MPDNTFFDEQKYQSEVKSIIVYKFFDAWFNVLHNVVKNKSDKRLAYIDLFAGRGYYGEGKVKSTPILILERAIERPAMRENLITYFNDGDPDNSQLLREAIANHPSAGQLSNRPKIDVKQVGPTSVEMLKRINFPYLLFADPWGYKGLSLDLFRTVLANWGTDCIFFFNFNRINMHMNNSLMVKNMNELFSEERADHLRDRVKGMSPWERETTIVDAVAEALKGLGGKFVIPFPFKTDDGSKTSHHLIYTTKKRTGHDIMKNIMAKASTSSEQGVPSFVCDPTQKPGVKRDEQGLLFSMPGPLDDLEDMLPDKFAGRELTARQVYDEHNVGTRYTERNYKEVIRKLASADKVSLEVPPGKKLVAGTLPDWCIVKFPNKGV